eukprot:UN31750
MGEKTSAILGSVKELWESCSHNLVRAAVVGVLTSVVKALKSRSQQYHQFLIPVLVFVTDFTQEGRLYLTEVGLDLWLEVIRNSSKMTRELLELFKRWIFCMDRFVDYLQVCLNIFKSYLLLGQQDFVKVYMQQLQGILGKLITNVDVMGMQSLSSALTIFIQMFPKESPQFLQRVIERVVIQTVDMTHPFTPRDIKAYFNSGEVMFREL